MNKIIEYMGHRFIFNENMSKNNYGEFDCEICKISVALKYIKYTWHQDIWKKLDITCNEVLIKNLLE